MTFSENFSGELDEKTAEFLHDIQNGYGDATPEIAHSTESTERAKRVGEVALDDTPPSGRIDDGYGDREETLPFHWQIAQANQGISEVRE